VSTNVWQECGRTHLLRAPGAARVNEETFFTRWGAAAHAKEFWICA